MASPRLLLINPWIYDFAAFDLWMKPMGLLYMAGFLREQGYTIQWLDCLDRYDPDVLQLQGLSAPRVKAYGTGKFYRKRIAPPVALQKIPYPYRCYGMPEEIFLKKLRAASRPDAILVTSMMTYWYPGVFRAIELAKAAFPGVPVVLGGVYARLCGEHAARYSQADDVVGEHKLTHILQRVDALAGVNRDNTPDCASLLHCSAAFDLYPHLDYACILTSLGCPYRCTYCASHLLSPQFTQRPPHLIFQEIVRLYRTRGIQHFAFYDDALLVNAATHLEPLLEQVIAARLPLTFHTPNGLHARYISERTARLMFQAGFRTVRLSLETTDAQRQQATGGKVTSDEFESALNALRLAGFRGDQIGVYLFVGLPGQDIEETERTIRYVHRLGVTTNLCEYSPIPGTREWTILERDGYVGRDDDPVLHNNSVFLFFKERHTFERIQQLKDLVRALNRANGKTR